MLFSKLLPNALLIGFLVLPACGPTHFFGIGTGKGEASKDPEYATKGTSTSASPGDENDKDPTSANAQKESAPVELLDVCEELTGILSSDPIAIHNADDLKSMKSGQRYVIAEDISLSSGWEPLSLQNISLDGQGHVIRDAIIAKDSQSAGLFASVGCGVLNHMELENFDITSHWDYVGALAAQITNVFVSDVQVKGSFITGSVKARVGGLFGVVGSASKIAIIENIRIDSTTTLLDDEASGGVGGIIGEWENPYTNSQARLSNSVVEASIKVKGPSTVGGFAGAAWFAVQFDHLTFGGTIQSESNECGYIGGCMLFKPIVSDLKISGSVNCKNPVAPFVASHVNQSCLGP